MLFFECGYLFFPKNTLKLYFNFCNYSNCHIYSNFVSIKWFKRIIFSAHLRILEGSLPRNLSHLLICCIFSDNFHTAREFIRWTLRQSHVIIDLLNNPWSTNNSKFLQHFITMEIGSDDCDLVVWAGDPKHVMDSESWGACLTIMFV